MTDIFFNQEVRRSAVKASAEKERRRSSAAAAAAWVPKAFAPVDGASSNGVANGDAATTPAKRYVIGSLYSVTLPNLTSTPF